MKAAPFESTSIDGNSRKLRSPGLVGRSQLRPRRQISPRCTTVSLTLFVVNVGDALSASIDCAMCMFQTPDALFAPGVRYQITSTRPGSPATTHGMMFVPVISAGLTRIGWDQLLPRSVEAAI